jgi:hypothetical protein
LSIGSLLNNGDSKAALGNLAAAFGLDRATAEKAAASLATALSQKIERNTLSRGGVADVVDLIGNPHIQTALNRGQDLASPDVADAGNDILDVLTGSKHISRGIAARTASEIGISEDVAKKMLPVVASLLVGGLQRQTLPELSRLMRNVPDLKNLAPNLAMSRNGSPLPLPGEVPMDSGASGGRGSIGGSWGRDDTAESEPAPQRQAQSRPSRPISGGGPLPIPGDNIPGMGRGRGGQQDDGQDNPQDSPYDNLPDVIRRGGIEVPGGGTLENVIRTILGGLLGFKNRGILGSLLQLFLINFLPRILKGIFGRVLGRG